MTSLAKPTEMPTADTRPSVGGIGPADPVAIGRWEGEGGATLPPRLAGVPDAMDSSDRFTVNSLWQAIHRPETDHSDPSESVMTSMTLDERSDLNPPSHGGLVDITSLDRQRIPVRIEASVKSFAEGLRAPIDNLQRALASSIYTDSTVLLRGVETALRQLRQLLRQQGIETESEPPKGPRLWSTDSRAGRYDPTEHNDAILQMLQRGPSARPQPHSNNPS